MKALKLNHDFAQQVKIGQSNATWRINDDKDLHVNDVVALIDKVDPLDPSSWVTIGYARITSVLEKQLGKITVNDISEKEKLPKLDELLERYRSYYGPQVSAETPVKIINFTFDQSMAQDSPDNGHVVEKVEFRLYSDGGSRGNPGPSACGYVLMDTHNNIIAENGVFLGVTTNNQAEYQSLKLGLESAIKMQAKIVHVYMDSMLVINQMKGVYKVKNHDLIPVNSSVRQLVAQIDKVTFNHIPREMNRKADSIVNDILDHATINTKNHSFPLSQ